MSSTTTHHDDRTPVPSVTPPTAPAPDVADLAALVAEVERTQQQEDVDGFLALFDADAVWVNGAGRRLIGLQEIADFTRAVLPGAMRELSVSYDVQHIAFITPDVALTGVVQQYRTLDGTPTGDAGSPSYVWSRTDGGWRLVAGQNTTVWRDLEAEATEVG